MRNFVPPIQHGRPGDNRRLDSLGTSRPRHRGGEELRTIHIIAGTKTSSAIQQFSEKARAAGATFQTFDTLAAMANAIKERNFGKMVIVADSSLATGAKEIKEISDARGTRKETVPIFIAGRSGKETLPLNVHDIQSTRESINHFNQTVLNALESKKP